MNSHYTYFLVHLFAIAGPLALSFDKRVAFYTKWRYLFPAMILPAIFFLVWDSYFTSINVWWFSEEHTMGWNFYGLPVEEILFFFTVPYCCLFIYECIRCYFPLLKESRQAENFLMGLGFVLLVLGIYHVDLYYTGYTFLLLALFIGLIYIFRRKPLYRHFDAIRFLVAFAIILIPFLLVNGVLTAIPVVMYDDTENLGIRIYTIPLEDVFYGMLLILMNVVGYEYLRYWGGWRN
jgi:lycopene cyclase domain-containing protein